MTRAALFLVPAFVLACAVLARAPQPAPPVEGYQGFGAEQQIALPGYRDDAMEPFISDDGRELYFNSSNAPGANTDLFVARRGRDGKFAAPAALTAINSPALDGVPSMDRSGKLYLVSLRSYSASLSTLYRAQTSGKAAPQLVPGVSPRVPGIVQFDAEVSWDGASLWLSEGRFSGKPFPDSARIVLARRDGAGFRYAEGSDRLLAAVNSGGLNYAAAISRDGLELFFTRAMPGRAPVIMRAARSRTDAPFQKPQRVAAVQGHVEAPSLSRDGLTLYYHKQIGGRFVLCRVVRQRR